VSKGTVSYIKKTHRFGLLTPSSNTTQEPEFFAALPRPSRCTPGAWPTATSPAGAGSLRFLELETKAASSPTPKSTSSCSRDRPDARQGQGL